MKRSNRRSTSLAARSVLLFATLSPMCASLFPIAFADTAWNPNLNPTWTTGSATLSANILGGSITQTGGDVSSTDLIEIGGPSFGGLYTIGGGTFNVGGIWVGRIGDPPSQFVQNAGNVTVSLLEITDGNGKYILNGGTLTVNHVNFDYPGAGVGPGGSLVLNGGTLVTSTIALGFGSGYVGRFYFNGGTLKADPAVASSSLGWIQVGSGSNSQIYTYVGQFGGQLDTNGTDQVIYTPLLHDPSYSGTDGGITKLGAGTLTLVADNTYTGVTTISAGTLQIGNGGTTGSILGNVTNNATLIFNRADTLTYGGVISGTGNLVKNGGGTLTLSGSSTFTGGTTVNAGTLKLTVGGSVGTIRGALTINPGTTVETDAIDAFGFATGSKVDSIVVNGGTINHTAAGNIGWGVAYTLSNGAVLTSNGGVSDATALSAFAFGGPSGGDTSVNVTAGVNTINGHVDLRGDSDNPSVSNSNVNFTVASGASLNVTAGISSHNGNTGGPVGLTKLGAGLMTFTGANTYNGPTTVNGGSLQFTQKAALPASSALTVSAGATAIFNVGGTGDFAASDIATRLGGFASGSILSLDTSHASSTFTYGSALAGGFGLLKQGAGTLALSARNTFSGPTTVTAGTLLVDGALTASPVSVQSGATLGGTGELDTLASVHIGGHIAPGDTSTGTLTFTAGLSLESGVVLDFGLGSASDLIRVSGGTLSAPSSGTLTLNILDAGGFSPGSYVLFDYTGATAPGFSGTDFTLGNVPGGFNYAFATQGNTLELLVSVPEPGVAALLTVGVLLLPRRRRQRRF